MDLSTDSMEGLDITSDSNIFSADSQRNILELKLKLLSKESEEKYDEVTFGVCSLISINVCTNLSWRGCLIRDHFNHVMCTFRIECCDDYPGSLKNEHVFIECSLH
jgi:hypothetical protein